MKKVMKAVAALMLMVAAFYPAECLNAQNHNGHDYVDLGLPSGTLWATCNVGATTPEGYGDYFAWGETQPKKNYDWITYKYANGKSDKLFNYDKLTKYCNKSDLGNNGFTDKLTTLQPGDDPATANWGSGWCTPSKEQWEELKANTIRTWTTRNGMGGMLFTGFNGNSLFLPAADTFFKSVGEKVGSVGYYWSSSLDTDNPDRAWNFSFGTGGGSMNTSGRCMGASVRAVRSKFQK